MLIRIIAVLALQLGITTTIQAEWLRHEFSAMTAPVELVFWWEGSGSYEQLLNSIEGEFKSIEGRMSRHIETSELSQVNSRAANEAVNVSADLFSVLLKAQHVAAISKGAFDITFASVGQYYDFRSAKQPSADQIASLKGISYRDITLLPDKREVVFSRSGLVIDLGGIAKGYAVDRAVSILRSAGIKHGRVSAGGDMKLIGDKRGKPWILGVKHPRVPSEHATVLPLSDVAVSTSGDYERFFIDADGRRVHHILSPASGRPVYGVQSVTVLGPEAIMTDALSTTIFVLGVTAGLAFIEDIDAYDVIIIDDKLKMHVSSGLQAPQA